MTDDPPLDLPAVAADDAALDALRAGTGDDPALSLLRELLLDVERDLPATPLSHGTTVVALAADGPDRRMARNGTVVAALAAGLLSLGGVAAASTLVPAGGPLHGLGEAVRSAAGAVVGAVTPPSSSGRPAAALPAASASPSASAVARVAAPAPRTASAALRTPTPGATVSAAARSQAAARQVDQLLADADALLDAGRRTTAVQRLDLAERKLTEVLEDHRGTLPKRLADLRARATAAPAAKPTRSPKQAPAKAEADDPKADKPAAPKGGSRTAPPKSGKAKGKSLLGQLSSDASMKPRA